ncbi:CoA protein activase [Abyssisolibacter fermentans]|uniref:CoA protein activase n=1 Tax=Abyssisolibacter fermentans TaxID=1766203 RepID=UPI00083108F8|nr:CoA protein activase [Abyssisolibacter fermentans]
MKITFPHMGNAYIGAKAVVEDLGYEVIIPPKCNKKTLEIGTKYSPETICLPLKINIGNYIESIKRGADTILITGSRGPCRFGLYSVIEEEILKDLGYNVNFIVVDPPSSGNKNIIANTGKLSTKNKIDIVKCFLKGKHIVYMADELTKLSNRKRAYASNKREIDKIMDDYMNRVENCKGSREIIKNITKTAKYLDRIKENSKDVIKIGIVGEIYSVIEPFVNLEIERKLGNFNVLVHRYHSPSAWVENHLTVKSLLGMSQEREILKAARPYLKTLVGGHGRETVGGSVLYAQNGYDGIIQIYPFGCMPEIVAASILPSIGQKYNIPIMTFIVDEMTGEAGYLTRIEAFVDLLRNRKEKINSGKSISWG